MICVIDYGLSNIKSVCSALKKLDIRFEVVEKNKSLNNFSGLILPGVGAFNQAMTNLQKIGLDEEIKKQVILNKKKIMGICLGMQLLMDESEENVISKGLGLISGKVKKIKNKGLSLPHVGWNNTKILKNNKIFKLIPDNVFMYYVHNYCVHLKNKKNLLATTDYGIEITSVILGEDHIYGFQAHPEKSQLYGLKILENFCKI